tara:strand:- start:254 stop:895 length:642 start_codon:yes stop_codon:yes gene_type:complete
MIKNILFIVYIMVLQSNPRIRNAKSNEGKTYLMGNVLMMGAGNKAGTGRSATTRYNVKFLKDMGACCKSGYSDDALRVMKLWDALMAEYNRLKEVVTQVSPNQWSTAQTLTSGEVITANAANFPKVPKLTAATAGTGNVVLGGVATYANQGLADTRADSIKVELNLIRTAWEGKSTQNPANGNILPEIKKADHTIMSAAEVNALAPNVSAKPN